MTPNPPFRSRAPRCQTTSRLVPGTARRLALATALAAGLGGTTFAQEPPRPPQQPGPQQPGPQQPAPQADERKFVFTFRRGTIQAFIGYLSREAGFTFVEEAGVTGEITTTAEGPISRDEALEILRAWLLPKQRTLLRTGNIVRIITVEEARRRGLPVRIGSDPVGIADTDELVTQVMPLRYVRAADVKTELSGLLSDKGSLMQENTSNALVITDTSASIRRFAEVLAALDKAVTAELHVRVYRLTNARADEVATIVEELFANAAAGSGGQAAGRGGQGGRGGRGGGGGGGGGDPREQIRMFLGGGPGGGGTTGAGAQPTTVNVSADARTNSVVVTASTDQLKLVDDLVKELDRDPDPVVTEIRAFPLVNADAEQLKATLESLFAEESTTAQGRNAQGGQGGQGFMQRIFGQQGGGGGGGRGGQGGQQGGGAEGNASDRYAPKPKFTTDVRTNTLIVSANATDMAMIEALTKDLDKDPTEASSVLVLQLQHAEAEPMATVLKEVLGDAATGATGAAGGANQQGAGQTARQQRQAQQTQAGASTAAAGATGLVGQVTVTADAPSNALVLTSSPKNFDRLRSIVQSLDVARREVFIECLIAEVQLSDRGELGIQWNQAFTNSADNREEGTQTLGTDFGLDSLQDGLRYTTTSDKLSGLLRALQTEGRLNILSSPKVLVVENQPAEISVGQEVPFVTNSRITQNGDTVNTIQYRDVGIILRVTPQISENGTVRMTVHPEVSSIAPDSESVPISDGVRSPTFNKNFADTSIVIHTGQTAVIGGMIQDTYSETLFSIPYLGKIPILGRLFGSTIREKVKQEIVVFLTPYVIESPGDLNRRSQAVLDNYAYVPTEVMQNELDRWLRDLRDDTHAFHYNRGTVLLESGRIEDAIVALRRAAELSASDASTRLNLGLALARGGKLAEAENALSEAERLDPRDAEIPYDLGAVLWRRGDFPRAARAFERAVALQVDHPEAARWLIRARQELARLEAELLERGRAAPAPPAPSGQESR